jgi:hypothetical protein
MKMTASIVAFLGIVASISTAVGKQPVVVEGVLLQLNKPGTNAVEISVGKDDGVKIGDTLIVSRKDRRLGMLKVSKIGRDRSAASIVEIEKGVDLQTGDQVAIQR